MKATMQKEGEKVTKPIISAMQIIGKYKKTIITAVAILIALPVLYGFISGAILKAQLKNAPQGELLFYTIRTKDIEDTKLKEWVETHYKVKGIHVYEGKKATNEKHVLLAAGEQKIPEISIELESVVGFRDKILINGKIGSNQTIVGIPCSLIILRVSNLSFVVETLGSNILHKSSS